MRVLSITKKDWLLLLGIILAPMTGLRIGKIGPAELLVFVWSILNIKKILRINISNYNFLFWLTFIFLIIIGTGYGVMFYPEQVNPVGVFTWIYLMFVSLGIYQGFKMKNFEYTNNFIKQLVKWGITWYLFLYIYSMFISNYFFGAPLWYENIRFSGGATNPHQISVLLGAFIPLTIKYIESSIKRVEKFFYIVLFGICLFLGYETGSSTLQLSMGFSLVVLFLFMFIEFFHSKKSKDIVFLLIIITISTIFILNGNFIMNQILTWINSDPNGLGRFEIFSTIGDTLNKNWVFGLGPGNHAFYGTSEYHNTYLEILAMGGILGLINFVIYSIKIFKVYSTNIYYVSSAISLYIYGLAGFSMRRLIFWAILMLFLAIAEKEKKYLLNKFDKP